MNIKEIPGNFYDIEYFLSMEWRYLSGAHQNKVDLLKRLLGDVRGKRVLDLGCGGGFISNVVAKLGANVVGTDYSESAIAFGKDRYPNLNLSVGNAKTLSSFERSSFDVVLLIDVIEHIHDQRQVLEEIKRILKPGGRIIISTDLEDSPWSKGRFSWIIWQSYRFSSSGRAYRLIKRVEEERRKKRNYHDSHVAIRSLRELVILLRESGYGQIVPHIYPLVKVPLRDAIFKLLPPRWRGDHVMIEARKV